MSAKSPLLEEHLPAIRGVMQLYPDASIYRLADLVQIRLKLHKVHYETLRKFLLRHGITTPGPQRRPAQQPRLTGPAEAIKKAAEARDGLVTRPVCLIGETSCDSAGDQAELHPAVAISSVTRDGNPRKLRPPARLTPAHLTIVRGVIAENPGLSLAKLCPLVAAACGFPHVTGNTLHRYLAAHGIERQVAAHVVHRAERLRARGVAMFPTSMSITAPVEGPQQVDQAHVSLGRAASSVFALGGRLVPLPGVQIPHIVPPGRTVSPGLQRIWRDEARREATTWLSAAAVRHAARAALIGALSRSREEPDPDEFDPNEPRTWWTVEGFARDVCDLFKLAIFELAYAHRPDDALLEHECNQLGRLGGAIEVMRALGEKAS